MSAMRATTTAAAIQKPRRGMSHARIQPGSLDAAVNAEPNEEHDGEDETKSGGAQIEGPTSIQVHHNVSAFNKLKHAGETVLKRQAVALAAQETSREAVEQRDSAKSRDRADMVREE